VSLACADEIEALVRASEDPAEARSLVLACTADIVRATVRGRDLNEQLLRLARRQPARTEEIDFSALVNEAIDLARRTFHHGIRVEREVAGGVRVVGDRSELHRALLNLMLNARDAMPSGGEFAVELRLGSDSLDPQSQSPERVVRVTVRDSGHGMDEETRARIFQPLFTTKRTGTGLGLPTVARIIAEHGGRIHCESAPRKGTSFEIVLPRASSDAALASPTSRPPMER
jgi:signal transduction histidine kinase